MMDNGPPVPSSDKRGDQVVSVVDLLDRAVSGREGVERELEQPGAIEVRAADDDAALVVDDPRDLGAHYARNSQPNESNNHNEFPHGGVFFSGSRRIRWLNSVKGLAENVWEDLRNGGGRGRAHVNTRRANPTRTTRRTL